MDIRAKKNGFKTVPLPPSKPDESYKYAKPVVVNSVFQIVKEGAKVSKSESDLNDAKPVSVKDRIGKINGFAMNNGGAAPSKSPSVKAETELNSKSKVGTTPTDNLSNGNILKQPQTATSPPTPEIPVNKPVVKQESSAKPTAAQAAPAKPTPAQPTPARPIPAQLTPPRPQNMQPKQTTGRSPRVQGTAAGPTAVPVIR
ncbi:mucin-7-like [Sitodiplosis mosellana]|uniref:mucin-7-like n=1 Tax=Sitodiplosis mosellana TaxID=263140 RepID=UPI002444F0D1|nr:mucin-7-like [Sitodiplosis mosellana]